MARNYFLGWSQASLEAALLKAQQDLAKGTTFTDGGAGDITVSREVGLSPEQRIDRLLVALNKLDPVTYPRTSATPTRVTVGKLQDLEY